ncbi:Hsp40 co-chaperone Jid1, putative [Talaromyces stipitatus ATCC 10500]|uniref:Hsp40 co-chaperone Jid1, putative n=1 Tax=Talaromyces stipitatus (strain ATCC 10500 / CBS 375.48 / QM 6759 / NRRL 1006) TaxID=441959 RepID=B8M6I5_TALSN|nr:Hsp40 co-chaperone Jid1, putative [Talaromyces stipitatus ATCC 10500]EED19447.1 Hsp40 co-chaperone Jid1, putative [Talaromyces stipitatus ATCC 10500]
MLWKQTVFSHGSIQALTCQKSRARCLQLSWRGNSSDYMYSRHYASVHSEHFNSGDHQWPTTPSFTPYEVLRQEPAAPYSKRYYYELVKIYHPDLQNEDRTTLKNVSEEVRLQRYRLVVAAHEILSNPKKRAAYDRDGSGWHTHPDHPDSKLSPKTYACSADADSSIFNNGTWEDWERYRNRNNPKQVQMVSHGTFISFIVLLVLFGGFAQASWITQTQLGLDQRVQEMNAKSARLLAKRRQQTDELKSREHRVQSFLMRRDPTGSGLKEEEENVYRQALDRQSRLPCPEDGAPGHTSKETIEELHSRGIYPIYWLAFSPDLNPIEAVWNWMKDWIQEQYPDDEQFSYDRLREVVRAAWDALSSF